jgi:chromate reductase, NAD(P)H dehydrogenase (quinone)
MYRSESTPPAMPDRGPRVLVLAGSIRAGSFNRKLAREAVRVLRERELETNYLELAEYRLPLYDGDLEAAEGLPAAARALKDVVREHDALVIASPEYNGSFPALVKNTIDWISRPEPGEVSRAVLAGKAGAVLSASPGPRGGRRGLRHLRELLEMVGMRVIAAEAAIPNAAQAFHPDGALARAEDREALEQIAAELSSALRAAKGVAA